MADNVAITAGAGTNIATDDMGAAGHAQKIKLLSGTDGTEVSLTVAEDAASAGGEHGIPNMGIRKDVPAALGADLDWTYPIYDKYNKLWVAGAYPEDLASTDVDPIMVAGYKRTDTPANSSGTDGDYEPLQGSAGKLWVKPLGNFVTVSTDVTRAANTTTYAINDNVGSTPSGGYTFTSIARISGGSGIITDVYFSFEEDAATPLQGTLDIFDSSFTEVADNSAWVVSDAESKTKVAEIPFYLVDAGNQGTYHAQNLNIGYTTVGSANLRFSIRTKNAYVPTTNSSVLTVRVKALQVD